MSGGGRFHGTATEREVELVVRRNDGTMAIVNFTGINPITSHGGTAIFTNLTVSLPAVPPGHW